MLGRTFASRLRLVGIHCFGNFDCSLGELVDKLFGSALESHWPDCTLEEDIAPEVDHFGSKYLQHPRV